MKKLTIFLFVLFAISMTYGQEIPTEGLVGYWKLDEGEGSVAADSSGYGAHGELFGTADWVPGYIGNAVEFDGIDAYVDCGLGEGQFEIEDALTLSVWVNQWDFGNSEHNPWIVKGDHSFSIKHHTSNTCEFCIYQGTWYCVNAALDESCLYEWHHYAGTYDGEFLKAYIDGQLAIADTLAEFPAIALSTQPVNLGRDSENVTRLFMGQIDEAMIYNVALTDEQIMQLYNIKSDVMYERTLANQFYLRQNYPNPFNPVTNITYTIPAALPVTLNIYNALGHQVRTLVNERQNFGTHSLSFDASDLPSGIYFYKLQAGDQLMAMKKMMFIK
ncbi:T9SS type A sorting domain-containing protein [candidate division KSB1 bacterium]|nr:T9SS type A sorting domain-containing protein [candidate division KSB1 bacterium]